MREEKMQKLKSRTYTYICEHKLRKGPNTNIIHTLKNSSSKIAVFFSQKI